MKKENTPQIDPKQEEIIEEIAEIKEVAAALEEEQEKEDAFAVEDTSPETEEAPAEGKDNEAKEAKDPAEETDGPLSSFLNREEETEKKNDKDSDSPKKKKIPWWIIVCGAVVIALVVILLVLLLQPIKPSDDQNQYQEAQFEISVDENGEHQAQVPTNEAGEIEQNGVGTLLAYDVFSVSQIDVQNQSGSFSVTSYTPTTTDEDGNEVTDTTVYTLVGFENFELQSGTADAVANDAANIKFNTIASLDGNLSDFGFDNPQAVVNVKYNDNTSSLITLGADAPADEGIYFTFGESNVVYLAAKDSVDSFLYSINDLISLSVTPQAEDVDSSQFGSLEISGSRYPEKIVLEPNNDEAIKTDYIMTSPYKMFASATESADIAGAVRGVYAEKVLCVNPTADQIASYGLSDPYAKVIAQYPDVTIEIKASAPDSEGNVNIMTPDIAAIYSIQLGAVEWANTSVEKLRPDAVLEINKEAVTSITFDINGVSRKIDVTSTTESVENDEGETEEVTSTKAEYSGQALKEENFSVFFQNLTDMKLLESETNPSVSGSFCTITITYSTGREPDVIRIDNSSDSRLPISLNGETIGTVYKSYAENLVSSLEDLTAGKTVKSL
ncbi:MAG: DUF4340 domain-containing protein [Ruminococcus sp.]|nr:DUF4340 domain-containing protein [Ruminococcus sp.]